MPLRNVFASCALLMMLAGCCRMPITYPEFKVLPLEAQLDAWQRVTAAKCHTHSAVWLSSLGRHGYRAADVARDALLRDDGALSKVHAILVIESVHHHGYDMRAHGAFRTLQTLAASHSDPDVRAAAAHAVARISDSAEAEQAPRP